MARISSRLIFGGAFDFRLSDTFIGKEKNAPLVDTSMSLVPKIIVNANLCFVLRLFSFLLALHFTQQI